MAESDKKPDKKPAKKTTKKSGASRKATKAKASRAAAPSKAASAEPKLNVCFVAAEVAPFAKTGGLADVSAALPAQLKRDGHDVRVFMPLYSTIRFEQAPKPVEFLHHVPIRLGEQVFHFSVFTTRLPDSEVDVYFIGCPPLYDRDGIYTGDWDDHLRFAFLSQAALKCCQFMGWAPDIVHANDWHTALVPLYLQTLFAWDRNIFG